MNVAFRPWGAVGIWLITAVSAMAQDRDIFKDLLKESMKATIQQDLKIAPLPMESFPDSSSSGVIELDVNKQPIPSVGYNRELNSLYLHYKDSLPLERKPELSPAATEAFTNPDYHPKYDPIMDYQNLITPKTYEHLSGAGLLKVGGGGSFSFSEMLEAVACIFKNCKKHEKALKHITQDIYPAEE